MNNNALSLMEKMVAARIELQGMTLKKSGYNEFSKFHYFTLADFLPEINKLADKYRFFAMVSYDTELATMTITNLDNPEDRLVFTSPMSTAKLTASHEVQNLGAVQTYLRRYFYMTAFEVVENDELDATSGKPAPAQKPAPKPAPEPDEYDLAMTKEQITRLQTFAVEQFGQEEGGKAYKQALEALGVEKSADLNKSDFEAMKDALADYQPLPFGYGD